MTPQELQKLKQTWYKKLKRSGFKDIEDDKGRLKQHHSEYFKNFFTPLTAYAQERYFTEARHLLYDESVVWKAPYHKKVWAAYAEESLKLKLLSLLRSQHGG